MSQRQRGWRENVGGPAGIALSSENVEDDVGGVDALDDRLSAGGFDRQQSVGEHRGEDVDHLPIAVIDASELAPYALHCGWQHPVLERSAVAQGAWLAGEHRDVVPRVVERIPAAKRAGMFGDDPSVLTDHDAVRIGMNFDGTPNCVGSNRVFVVVEPYQAGLRHRRRHRMEAVKPARIANELRPFRLEHVPDRLIGQLPRSQAPLNKANARSWASNTISCVSRG